MLKRIPIACFLIWSQLTWCGTANASNETGLQENCNQHGFHNIYYLVDLERIGEVSAFFQSMGDSYFNNVTGFTGATGNKSRNETYYDTEDRKLFESSKEVLFLVNNNLSFYRIDREQVIFRDFSEKQEDQSLFEVKRYKKKITPIDKHPLLGRVKRSERQILLEKIGNVIHADPIQLEAQLRVQHNEVVYLFTHYGVPYGTITLDNFHISNYGIPNTSVLLKFELTPAVGQLPASDQTTLHNLFCEASRGFQQHFPELKPRSRFVYHDYLRMAESMLPSRQWLSNHPLLYQLGQILILSIIGFMILYLILARKKGGNTYQVIAKSKRKQ